MPSRHSNVRFRPAKLGVALFELIDDAQRLQVVLEAAVLAHARVQRILAGVPKGRVPEIVRQADRLGERFIDAQCARDGARDLRDLDRMRHARAVQIAFVIHEHLRLVDQAAEGVGMDDAIAVALELACGIRGCGSGCRRPRDCVVVRGVGRERCCGSCSSEMRRQRALERRVRHSRP